MKQPVVMTVETDSPGLRGKTTPGTRALFLLSPDTWCTRRQSYPGDAPILSWVQNSTRGRCDLSRRLGSRRTAEKGDRQAFPAPFTHYFSDCEAMYKTWHPALKRTGDMAVLHLSHPVDAAHSVQIRIDTKRRCIVEAARYYRGKLTSAQRFSDFIKVAGAWWPQTLQQVDGEKRRTGITRITCKAIDKKQFAEALTREMAAASEALLFDLPLPEVVDAKQNVRDGDATVNDRWRLMNYFAATQRWEEVHSHFKALAALSKSKPAEAWLRLAVLKASRRNEEARTHLIDLAEKLENKKPGFTTGTFALARRVYTKGNGILQHIERLALLEMLKQVFQRQDERLLPMKTWHTRRLEQLNRLDRGDDAFALRKKLARMYPYDISLQRDYAQALASRGEIDQGLSFLNRQAEELPGLTGEERHRLRSKAASMLYSYRRLEAYLRSLEKWIITDAERAAMTDFDRMLTAFVMLDREREADKRIAAWLEGSFVKEENRVAREQLKAALRHALGRGDNLYSNRIEKRWRPVLCRLVRNHIDNETLVPLLQPLFNNRRFKQTDEGAALQKTMYGKLTDGIDTLPAATVQALFTWTKGYTPSDDEMQRNTFYAKLFARWQEEADPREKRICGRIVAQTPQVVALRRRQFENAPDGKERSLRARQLFTLLAEKPWSEEVVRELTALISHVGYGDTEQALTIDAIQVFTRYIVDAHSRLLREKIPGRNKLDARALRPLEQDAGKKARSEAVLILKKLEEGALDMVYRPFVTIERLTLEAGLGDSPKKVFEDVLALFAKLPEPEKENGDDAMHNNIRSRRKALCERCLLVAGCLAVKEGADPALSGRLLDVLDEHIEKQSRKTDVKAHKYRMLVVLDRPDTIEKLLSTWAGETGEIAGNRWRIPYGYILAEQGKLKKAVNVFENVRKTDELGAPEYSALAGWYMVLDKKQKRRDARINAFTVMNEWTIRSLLDRSFRRYDRRSDAVPEALDDVELLRFSALLRKSATPSRHLYLLRRYYEATKDFRLLETLPEAVIGQSAAKIYDFLCNTGQLIELIGDEATCDRIQEQLAAERKRVHGTVDLRALYLLQFLVQRRAADQAHGAGPHVDAALIALKKAFKPSRQEGEPELMARLLASVGGVVPELRTELLRQLQVLHERSLQGSRERFMTGVHRASGLWHNEKRTTALAVLEAALSAYRHANGGFLPQDDDNPLYTYAGYLIKEGEYKTAEKVWRNELARGYNKQRKRKFTLWMYDFYAKMILHKHTTRQGNGMRRYRAVRDELLNELKVYRYEYHARNLVNKLGVIYRNAHKAGIEDAADDVRTFAFSGLPRILRMYNYRQGQTMVRDVADEIKRIAGPRAALAFLINRAENEPRWLRRKNQQFWRRHAWRTARWRSEVKDLGGLAPRLLSIVGESLRRALMERRFHCHYIHHRHHSYFWAEKREDFFRIAMEVLETHGTTEAGVTFIAEYLWEGLDKHTEAIDALQDANRSGRLARKGRWLLVTYLQKEGRHKESLPLLEGDGGLVLKFPDEILHHTALMTAYFHTGRLDKLHSTYESAVALFKKKNMWNEHVIYELAKGCFHTKLYEQSAAHYDEVIALRRKKVRNRRGDSRLSRYYRSQSSAYRELHKTKEAVDAALGAVVVWGRTKKSRDNAMENLIELLTNARDLQQYADAFDGECEESGLEKPVLRKALGKVFLKKKDFKRAVTHLEAYVESGPFDREVYTDLIEAYDKGERPDRGTERLMKLARESGHNVELYRKLGLRLRSEGKSSMAERAFTTMAELSAHESEGHAMLASLWEKEKRFEEAARQWAQVARVRSKEPDGYLGRARCLKRAGRKEEAIQILQDVLGRPWPARFGNVHKKARNLLK